MFRYLAVFVLASSLLALCQTPAGVTVNGGYVSPAMPGPPLLTPPNVALPGSGPATGAPPAVGVNDPRNGGSGSVFQPSPGTLLGTENTGAPTPAPISGLPATTAGESTGTSVANQPFNVGIGAFSEAPTNQPEVSLGDIARRYKAERANAHPRQFDNNNIRHAGYGTKETNSAALPQSDQASATYGSSGARSVPEGVINPDDYAAVQAALARTQAATNTSASNNTVAAAMPDPNRSWSVQSDASEQPAASANTNQQQVTTETQGTTEATTPQIDNPASADQTNARPKKQLPASGSPLPLIAVLGLIALAAGGIFTHHARSDNR